jgi:hypothetical protein
LLPAQRRAKLFPVMNERICDLRIEACDSDQRFHSAAQSQSNGNADHPDVPLHQRCSGNRQLKLFARNEGIARQLQQPTITTRTLSLTPRFSGVYTPPLHENRFSGLRHHVQTTEAVYTIHHYSLTPLKQGVNEKRLFRFPIIQELLRSRLQQADGPFLKSQI